MNFEGLSKQLLSRSTSLLSHWLPGGRLLGSEYTCGSLRGEEGSSCKVNTITGKWGDFATGEKGGDLISLYAAIEGISQGEAYKRLADEHPPYVRHVEKSVHNHVENSPPVSDLILVPNSAPAPNFTHSRFGPSTQQWQYTDAEGNLAYYTARYDPPAVKKKVLPWSFSKTQNKWVMKSWPEKLFLYNLLNAVTSGRPILIVEGEKSADAAEKILNGKGYSVVTWMGGTSNVKKSDWTPLFGKKILIWPDADEVGYNAAIEIASILNDNVPEVKIIDTTRGQLPSGWDAADALNEGMTFDSFVTWAKPLVEVFGATRLPAVTDSSVVETETSETVESIDVRFSSRAAKAAVIHDMPDRSTSGKPLPTYANLVHILNAMGIVVRYNVILKEIEILIPGVWFPQDNRLNDSITWIKSWASQFEVPPANLAENIDLLCGRNLYNPVITWVTSKPWDGVSRLEMLYETVTVFGEGDNEKTLSQKKLFIKKWMLSAIAAAFQPNGVSAHGVLVFQGPQHMGKTSWLKSLAPKELDVIMDGVILNPADKDSVKQACSRWLIELGELDATFKKSDIAQLKAFITKDFDVMRMPYGRKESRFPRKTVFFASVNANDFLNDPTGNRRFWCLDCTSIDFNHGLDMQQIWAEVYQLYLQKESWYLTIEENQDLSVRNEEFMTADPIEEKLSYCYNWSSPRENWRRVQSTILLNEVGYDKPTKSEVMRCAQAILKLNGNVKSVMKDNKRAHLVPPYKQEQASSFPWNA